MKTTNFKTLGILALSAAMTTPAFAIPSLQLGPGDASGWTYVGGGDDTWYTNSVSFTLNAYANATKGDGGNGDYAWATSPDSFQYAYLVASSVPDYGNVGDLFTLSITNAALVTSGYGAPPVQDPNSLAPHGIYDTYFEVYEFQFNGSLVDIADTQPGGTGIGKGYLESFLISWTETAIATSSGGLKGIHFDLFTVTGANGARYNASSTTSDKKLVQAYAPFSHDAQSLPPGEEPPPPPPQEIPEPSVLALLGFGLLGLGLKRKQVSA